MDGQVVPSRLVASESGTRLDGETLFAEDEEPIHEVCREIEKALGSPLELEFCIVDGKVSWLQVRKATRAVPIQESRGAKQNIVSGIPASPFVGEGKSFLQIG